MADDQADASGKYGMNGRGPQGSAKYWPTAFKAVELVSIFENIFSLRKNYEI